MWTDNLNENSHGKSARSSSSLYIHISLILWWT